MLNALMVQKQRQMKKWILLCCVLSSGLIFGQRDNSQNKWHLGGYVGASFGSEYTGFSISPSVGYELFPNLVAGATAGYQYSKRREVKQNLFSFGPFVNFYPINTLFLRAHFEHYIGNQKLGSETYDFNEDALWLGAGYRSPGRVQFFAGVMYNVLYKEGESLFSSGFRPIAGVSFRL